MDIFLSTVNQMLLMFCLIIVGILLRKYRILPEDAHTVLAKLENYVLVPALTFSNWANNCTVSTLAENWELIFFGMALIITAVLLAEPLSRLFVRNAWVGNETLYERQIYKYAMTFGNYGFVGNYIVLSVWGSEKFFQYSMFTLGAAFVCSSWGVCVLIPKHKGQSQTIKSMLKQLLPPPMIALLAGCIVGLFHLKSYIPEFLLSACGSAGNCMGPIAMVLAGLTIGGYNWKELIGTKKVYVATLLRLVLIPALFMCLLRLIGANDSILTFTLIAFGTPLGLNTIVYPAAYGGNPKTGASMVLLSQIFSVFTIPLMYLVFIAGL